MFREAVRSLVGRKCCFVFPGSEGSSRLDLHFSPTSSRRKPLTNRALTDEERSLQGEYGLFIACSWRLCTSTSIETSAQCALEKWPRYVDIVKSLVGDTVTLVSLSEGLPYDLRVQFTSGRTLELFCDQNDDDPTAFNYFVSTPEMIAAVETNGRLSLEEKGK